MSPSSARAFVRDRLDAMDAELLSAAELLTSELVTNAVLHATSRSRVVVDIGSDRIRIAVHDDDPRLPVHRPPDVDGAGGRGLHLVDQLASRWGCAPDGTGKVVWFELDRGGQAVR